MNFRLLKGTDILCSFYIIMKEEFYANICDENKTRGY